ncbi:MAG TPA: hypothetical protein DCZ95_15965 [Verrucomicrobia bacterium]|nr:MAG: hypothetical protein A2X46_06785 [Lentisphaerae bacterium GWF2_57_35]HBA85579.1 hypothetical protein [Verrucomicrobiota bacterium]
MAKIEVKFGDWIQQGFDLYKNNIATLILATLIAYVLSFATLMILAGPMLAGLALITLRFLDKTEPKPEIGDLFKGFEVFAQSFLFVMVWLVVSIIGFVILNLVPCIGQIVGMFFVYALHTALMFSIFLIVEKKMDFWMASMESFNMVKQNFWPFLGLWIVASLIGSIGAIACGIGAVVTLPIYTCILAVAYRDVFSQPVSDTTTIYPEPPSASEPPQNIG